MNRKVLSKYPSFELVFFYVFLLLKLLILGERPKRFELWRLVYYDNVRKHLKRDINCYQEVSCKTLERATRLHSCFWEWLLKAIDKYHIRKESLDNIWEKAFRCGRIPPKLKTRVKDLVLQMADIKGRQDRLAKVCDIAGIRKRLRVYRACVLDEDKLNNGEFGFWWALDPNFAVLIGTLNIARGKKLALYSVEVPLDRIVFFYTKDGEQPEIILFNITRKAPTLELVDVIN